MLGLSTTAIGHRPLDRVISIYNTLKELLSLDYLELAVGTRNTVDFTYPDTPLVLHDSCLFDQHRRLHLKLEQPDSWVPYKRFIDQHQVLEVHIHAPTRWSIDQETLLEKLNQMQVYLGVPVRLEVMPNPQYHASCLDSLPPHPLVLDISHINIWSAGDPQQTKQLVEALLPQSPTIHLSHNDGYCDSHDLIPEDIWFAPLVSEWQKTKLVTYESLPVQYRRYERLDRNRKQILQQQLHIQ